MSESVKHTPPGPWRISSFEPNAGGKDRMVMGGDGYAVAYVSGRTEAEHEAIARLIAAAPELLEALDWLLASIGAVDDAPAGRRRKDANERLRLAKAAARAAIAKATEQPASIVQAQGRVGL